MSIPSTVTATLPPIHSSYYSYSNSHRHDQNQAIAGAYDTGRQNYSRIGPSYSGFSNHSNHQANTRDTTTSTSRPTPIASAVGSQPTSVTQGTMKRGRRPNWAEFYKNGIPDQVIYIDVTPEPAKVEKHQAKQTMRASNGGSNLEPAAKKRRTGPANNYNARTYSYSDQRRTQVDDSGSGTISTDRTTSQHTTAPTSLGSHGSHGSQGVYLDDQQVGQKRKRVTRQQAANEKKRKEIETAADAYSQYVPPPKPPIKAKDVHVPPVRDVGCLRMRFVLRLLSRS